jgi:WD40 repeat protein
MVHNLVGHEDSVSFLAWSPDDTMIISCSNDKKAKLWDTSVSLSFILFNM